MNCNGFFCHSLLYKFTRIKELREDLEQVFSASCSLLLQSIVLYPQLSSYIQWQRDKTVEDLNRGNYVEIRNVRIALKNHLKAENKSNVNFILFFLVHPPPPTLWRCKQCRSRLQSAVATPTHERHPLLCPYQQDQQYPARLRVLCIEKEKIFQLSEPFNTNKGIKKVPKPSDVQSKRSILRIRNT